MYEVRTRVPPGDKKAEQEAALLEIANRPNDFFWCRPDLDNGTKNRGWVVKTFSKARHLMKRLGKVQGVSVTLREATGRG